MPISWGYVGVTAFCGWGFQTNFLTPVGDLDSLLKKEALEYTSIWLLSMNGQKLLEAIRLSFQSLFSKQSHNSFGRCQVLSSLALSLANGVRRWQKDLTGISMAPA